MTAIATIRATPVAMPPTTSAVRAPLRPQLMQADLTEKAQHGPV